MLERLLLNYDRLLSHTHTPSHILLQVVGTMW